MKSYRNKICLLAAWIVVCAGILVNSAQAAEGQSSIRGVLYVNYSADLSYDVMYGADVEVLLLKGDGPLEKELESLRQKAIPQIRAQETAVSKAIGEARSATSSEKTKEKQGALKREAGKLEKLRSEYNKEVKGLLAKHTIQSTKTDKQGKFRFEVLSPSRHLLHARFEIRGTESWYSSLYPVELKQGEPVEVTLDKAAAISLYEETPP